MIVTEKKSYNTIDSYPGMTHNVVMILKHRVRATQKNTAWVFNTETAETSQAFFSRKLKPICGDYVELVGSGTDLKIQSICERDNTFDRADRKGRPQHIAANIDQMVIVLAVEPAPTRDIINRYLIAAELNRLKAVLVFNKSDLDSDIFDEDIKRYQALSYATIKCSTKDIGSLTAVNDIFLNKTSIIVGQSGVGKSSLSQFILQDDSLKTGKLSQKTGKGAHTTSVTQLYPLKEANSYLIDSPGVWEYGLWLMSALDLAQGFIEFNVYAGQCKFSNCSHIHEPGCAIMAATDAGEIMYERYESYLRIVDSMKYWS
ncbi:ribosome small subunit-dependent GTPase A [Marinicella sp. W31]|uniref:ribosome small subunit-dependent GTPase A n=1 Tax=Marinicella sp. W31 TaxID=3023713 RepID=UPI0037567229